jgi:predicted DNA-binding transcriptional regulator AlpA
MLAIRHTEGEVMNAHAQETAPEVLTATSVAKLLGVSPRSIFNLAKNRPDFPASVRFGRSRRWLRSEVVAWIKTQAPRDPPARQARRARRTVRSAHSR